MYMYNNGANTAVHVAIAARMLLGGVSVVFSLVVVVAICLPLIRDPKKRTPAASFNMYLVFLSIFDMMGAVGAGYYCTVFYCTQWDGTEDVGEVTELLVEYNPWPYTFAAGFCTPALLWIVPFVGHEILKLLRNSKNRKRCNPPILRAVALHGAVACLAAIVVFVALYQNSLRDVGWALPAGLPVYLAPIPWSMWIVYAIVKERLLRFGAGVGNRLRLLVVYFARIVLVYCLVLGSIVIVNVLAGAGVKGLDSGVVKYTGSIIWGIEGWLSFAVILTKPDVKKMVQDLLVGRACCRNQTGNDDQSNETIWRTRSSKMTQAIEQRFMRIDHEDGISKEFIAGIVNYLSDSEDDVDDSDDKNDDNENDDEEGEDGTVGRVVKGILNYFSGDDGDSDDIGDDDVGDDGDDGDNDDANSTPTVSNARTPGHSLARCSGLTVNPFGVIEATSYGNSRHPSRQDEPSGEPCQPQGV